MQAELGVFGKRYDGLKASMTIPEDGFGPAGNDAYRVGLLIPMCGSAGLWAPSCIASAQVALQEINRLAGIAGREVQMVMIDAAIEAETPVETVAHDLIESGSIDAIVGMHISAVRQRLTKVVRGRIPYIYTPLYEGGETSNGVFAIGDTPAKQLGPALASLHTRFRLKKWAMIGNDYVWPRVSHEYAKTSIAALGGSIVYEKYLPFSAGDLSDQVERIGASGADGVLVSLVGQDAVDFNRAFGAMDLHKKIIRLSCAVEENGLLASGEENLQRLFSSASYFSALNTPANANFREQYHSLHRDRAPVLNSIGQSTYEGFQFLASLLNNHGPDWRTAGRSESSPVVYKSARQSIYISNATNTAPIYLARANGLVFDEFENIQ